ncbi:hypothetical protein AXG93_1480s1070 [Marchantia polymorpha subsp. ruderalis]|uniref:Uncharacterized protein n=1 Tax=Marchantia polymorpha subsp. ruderalis TaxID=1480154 RepID=A0A176W0D5_MARPO|nr:hypothetical protein AXG93_1480s1070 [Marchantia polymorpha subsp. ruderalis]
MLASRLEVPGRKCSEQLHEAHGEREFSLTENLRIREGQEESVHNCALGSPVPRDLSIELMRSQQPVDSPARTSKPLKRCSRDELLKKLHVYRGPELHAPGHLLVINCGILRCSEQLSALSAVVSSCMLLFTRSHRNTCQESKTTGRDGGCQCQSSSYDDVVARLWTCTGRPFDIDSSCCQEVEKDVNKDCGWYTADFCSYFADAANEYCHVNYCPGDRAQIQSAVNNATRSG